MRERQTIADSKKAFHNAFPYVIPPIYRKVTDELLVELHLLGHQKSFKRDTIFAIGLTTAFESFTRGYRPEEHLERLFDAICLSNGFDPISIREKAIQGLKAIKGISSKEKEQWLKNKGAGAPGKLEKEIEILAKGNNHYSRLTTIGLSTLLGELTEFDEKVQNSIQETLKEVSIEFGFSKERVERDITQYSSNLEKINQALELMKEAVEQDRKRKKSKNI